MEYLWVVALVALLAAILVVAGRRGVSRACRDQQRSQALLAQSVQAASEDLARFTEQYQRLALESEGHPDLLVRGLHSRASFALGEAEAAIREVRDPAEVGRVTEILQEGLYTLACLEARVTGDPAPERRPPCFFNPAHGPSTRDVVWAPPRAEARTVPACTADAERLQAGADPNIRTVPQGARRVPHWEGGPAYLSWSHGYFGRWGRSVPDGMSVAPPPYVPPTLSPAPGTGTAG
jgi:hypothetical protein